MINWNTILDNVGELNVVGFAIGLVSGRELTELASYTSAASNVRNLLRMYGVSYARQLARKAVRRRQLV